MLKLVIALAAGIAAGIFLPGGFMHRPKSMIFNTALLGLLFFMGVNLGRDPELLSKLSDFGIISGLMSVSVVFFSLVSVFILIKLFGEKK
jgi:uncharacterized membrane protein YbjE (DUF340 family)